MIEFERPKDNSSIIKVIGVGGGGGNAVNYMHGLGIDGVDFIVCNTDSQALAQSKIPNKIQLGPALTQGLGAGANPEVGKQAGEESVEEIRNLLEVRTRMAFITAGMGGGTGTGAAPIVAKVCKELNILTVGIVTTPFSVEGPKRMRQAQEGIAAMREYVDTILIISNDKLRQQFGNLPFSKAFSKADDILATAAKCITDLITDQGRVNLDFNDVQTVMKKGGVAILGSAKAEGTSRAQDAVVEALNSPLLNDNEIQGAKWILLNVTSAAGDNELTLDELEIIQSYVQEKAGNSCDIIMGMGHDNSLGESISVTIIATGFNQREIQGEDIRRRSEPDKIILSLDSKDGKQTSGNTAPEQKKEEENPLSPKLVEIKEEPKTIVQSVYKQTSLHTEANETEQKYTADFLQKKQEKEVMQQQEKKQEIELVIKNAPEEVKPVTTAQTEESKNETSTHTNTRRPLTEMEMEEQRRFEEAKRAFDERAERLRNLNLNYSNPKQVDEMEKVPAYQRRKVQLEEGNHSSENYFSNYYVQEESKGEKTNANISTINTFLDGERPD